MTFTLVYSAQGRGAFPHTGLGGTLDYRGVLPGPYYRAPAAGSAYKMPGLTGALAVRLDLPCGVNDYAVHSAVKALQPFFGTTADGIFGVGTAAAVSAYQTRNGLTVDGVVGPQTCRSLFLPLVSNAATRADTAHVGVLTRIATGTMIVESQVDPGAVGVTTPEDLGIAQINGPAHPTLSVDTRLDPAQAIPWMVDFIDGNFKAMEYVERDAVFAYNAGVGGARSWVKAGRPDVWNGIAVKAYIDKILSAA